MTAILSLLQFYVWIFAGIMVSFCLGAVGMSIYRIWFFPEDEKTEKVLEIKIFYD